MGDKKIYINHYHQSENAQSDKDLKLENLESVRDILSKLIKKGKTIYIHCSVGMIQAVALLLFIWKLYCWKWVYFSQKHRQRSVIFPNFGVINILASIYKPGSDVPWGIMFYFTQSSFQGKIQKRGRYINTKEIARKKGRRNQRVLKKAIKNNEKETKRGKIIKENPKKKIVKKKIEVEDKK